MHNASIKALHQALIEKKISAPELLDIFVKRIEQLDTSLNSFITVTADKAHEQAKAAQSLIDKGEANPLTGIPIAHKDIFCTDGFKTSCGSKMLDNFIAPYNATAVDNCAQAGMVMLGKTNMDEFAFGSSNETSFYGTVNNPWDTKTVPGGSSGGSAAAVSARLTPLATGTDTGGSIRQPAAFCGITGLKPTYGSVSRYGMIAFASSLDQGGPMAKSAEDLSFLLQAMQSFDEKDSTSVAMPKNKSHRSLDQSLQGVKIGKPKEFFAHDMDKELLKAIDNCQNELEKLGATFVDVSLPNIELSVPCYYILAPAEASSNLSRYDGIRFGYRTPHAESLHELYTKTRSEGFGVEVKRRVMLGTYVLSAGYFDAYYIKAQQIRRLIRDDFKQCFNEVDMLFCPTTPTVAFKHGEHQDNPVEMYLSDIFTIGANLAGLPALSMPCGFSDNLPVGAQLIGQYFDESLLLNVAHQYQQQTDFHTLTPPGF